MKKNRKILALALAVLMSAIMLVSASGLEIFIIASSEEYETYATSAKYLEILNILKGYDDGELHLEDPILRYQAALLFARVISGKTDDAAWGTGASETYSDVPEYGPVMDYITGAGIIRGYGDGKFGYDAGITYQDMCAMFVRVLGYETEDMVKKYPMSYIVEIERLGLGLDNVLPTHYLNRGQVAHMIYTALVTDTKAGEKYIEEKFDVSDSITFVITATENFTNVGATKAEKGHFKATRLGVETPEEWVFPIEGKATASVAEADLIGKYISVVFDDATPTASELADEECGIVHASMVSPTVYENKGELSYVKFNTAGDTLYLGNKTYKASDLANTKFYTVNSEAGSVYAEKNFDEFKTALKANTYFSLEVYDYDNDGKLDAIYHTPYHFAQYAKRTYGSNSYVMVGRYDASPVTNVASGEKTNFVETFLVTGSTIPKGSYNPENTKISVGEEGAYSRDAKVTGEYASNGEFVLYSYNRHSGEFNIVENLGAFQTGLVTGYASKAKTVTLDGAAVGVGLSGALTDANGILVGSDAYAKKEALIEAAIVSQDEDKDNVKFLIYDTKIVYLEAFGETAKSAADEYAVIDIEASLEAALDADDEAKDVIHDEESVTLKKLNLTTGELEDLRVEKIYTVTAGGDALLDCKKIDFKYDTGFLADNTVYNTVKAAGTIFLIKDNDEDGIFEIYAYGTAAFESVKGAKVIQATSGADITFNYGKSNKFIDANANAGIIVERITTSDNTVSTIICPDGSVTIKGSLGTNSETPNGLYLTEFARVIAASDSQLVIFDPMSAFAIGAKDASGKEINNVFGKQSKSIWNPDSTQITSAEGVGFYLFLYDTEYIESSAKVGADGKAVRDSKGNVLYEHKYEDLYNLKTNKSEDVAIVTTSSTPLVTEVINSTNGVIRVDAEKNEAALTSFEEAFVNNDKYHNANFVILRTNDWVRGNLEAKDGKAPFSFDYNSNDYAEYRAFDSLKYTFIDLDVGASVDPDEYCFDDAFVFYKSSNDNRANYNVVTFDDLEWGVDYPSSAIAIKRHFYKGDYVGGEIENGDVTPGLTKGVIGKIFGQEFYSMNGRSDYYIPRVDEDGETIWSYEGAMRVKVRYVSFAIYDETRNALEAIIVRIGTFDGVVENGADAPAEGNMPSDNGALEVADE